MSSRQKPVVLIVAPDATQMRPGYLARDFLGRMPNLGIMYLASVLEAAGYPVVTLDRQHYDSPPLLLASEINSYEPVLVGFTLYDATMGSTADTIAFLRIAYNGPIVVGGYTATFHAEDILRHWPNVDYVITREGEQPLTLLLEHLAGTRSIESVPNLVYRRGEDVLRTPEGPLTDLRGLPWPRREWPETSDVTPLITRRGCYSRCTFCSMVPFYDAKLGPTVRFRPPSDIADEIAHCIDHGSTDFIFYDDDFGLSTEVERTFVRELASEIRRRRLTFQWSIELRARDVIRGAELLRELCELGLVHLSIGMESLLPRQLKLYNKGYTQADVLQALEIARTLPVDFQTNVIFWDPWLTLDEAVEHVALLDGIRIQDQLASANFPFFGGVLIPRRGTSIHELMASRGLLRPRDGAFWEYDYEFVDADVRRFRKGANRIFVERVRAVERPPAIWTFIPRLEREGNRATAAALRRYAAAVASAEFNYYRELLTVSRDIPDAPERERMLEEIHQRCGALVDRCAEVLPTAPQHSVEGRWR